MRDQEILGELTILYAQARESTDKMAPMDASDIVADICRYCAGHWQRWERSKLDGHAACVVTEGFKISLAQKLRECPALNINQVAKVLGVSNNVVRAWHQVGMSRLAEREKGLKKKANVIRVWEQKP